MSEYKISVYKIWYEDAPEEFYIGSTKESLAKRMTGHREACKRGKKCKIYNLMRLKGINNFKYILVASCMVTCRDEQLQFEQHWQDELKPTINMINAYTSYESHRKRDKEMREKNRDETIKKQAIYRDNNKDKISVGNHIYSDRIKNTTTRTCICGIQYNCGKVYARNIHYNSKHHTEYSLQAQQLFTIH